MINKFNITTKNINNFSNKFNKTRTNKVLKNVNTKTNFRDLIIKSDYFQNKKQYFKNKIKIKPNITDQKHSGRCWLFACLNVMRIPMIKKYNLNEDFEFSQNFLFFYDKLEKANTFCNNIISYKKQNLNNIKNYNINDLKLIYLLNETTSDGGQWNEFTSLIEKYGIVPKTNMDDHFHSKNTHELNEFYNNYLRKSAKKLMESRENKNKLIKDILEECYKILVIFLGEPPKKITWEYYTKNKKEDKYNTIENISPIDFYKKYVPFNAKDKVMLINYPCKNIPYYKLYNVELTDIMTNGFKENYINVPMDIIKKAIMKSIDNEEAVYTGVEFGKFTARKEGFLDPKGFNYNDIFGFDNIMEKCDALTYRQGYPNHAVVIHGYNFNSGKTKGFLIENSHGQDKDNVNSNLDLNGYFYMSEEWFNNYVFKVVVDKKFLSSKELKVLKQKPTILPFWNPFGSLMNRNKNKL